MPAGRTALRRIPTHAVTQTVRVVEGGVIAPHRKALAEALAHVLWEELRVQREPTVNSLGGSNRR